MIRRAAVVLALLWVALPAWSASPSAYHGASLQSVFTPATLEGDLDALTQKVGYPKMVGKDTYAYQVGPCRLEVVTDGLNAIQAMGVEMKSPQCAVNLNRFMGEESVPLRNLRMGTLHRNFGGEYRADCLIDCVRGLYPRVYLYLQGYHANRDIDVRLSTVAPDVATQWGATFIQEGDEGYVRSRNVQCKAHTQAVPASVEKLLITRVDVGYDLDPAKCPRDEH